MKDSIHDKAIRLVEGGAVNIDGHPVELVKVPDESDTCYICAMDSLCHLGSEMCAVCIECEEITRSNCLLKLHS